MSEEIIKEVETIVDQLNEETVEPQRHYLSNAKQATWKMDWNMLLYQHEMDDGFQLDWNKLLYNDEQLIEFNLQKNEKILKPDRYEYLFETPNKKTAMEIYYLKQAGYDVDNINDDINDDIYDDENEKIIERLIVTGLLRRED